MKEWIVGRNPVYEVLRAKRRQIFRLVLAKGSKIEGQLASALSLARDRRIRVEEAARPDLDNLASHHQGIALECSEYPYAALEDLLSRAKTAPEAPFFLLLDLIQDPQNLGTLLRTAEIMGIHGVVIPSSPIRTSKPDRSPCQQRSYGTLADLPVQPGTSNRAYQG